MGILESAEKRRSYYQIGKKLPTDADKVVGIIEKATELVPDAFNMKSARVIIAMGEKQDALWDKVYDAFKGKVSREKIDGFKAGAGTVLYFIEENVVRELQSKYPTYAENFPVWAQQANGMLQFTVWTALRDIDIGATVQHYNPVINNEVKKLFAVPDSWILNAQMPFGGIEAEPEAKEKEDISLRVKIYK